MCSGSVFSFHPQHQIRLVSLCFSQQESSCSQEGDVIVGKITGDVFTVCNQCFGIIWQARCAAVLGYVGERERQRDGIDLSCFSNSKSIVSQSKTKAHCPGPADCCYASIGFYEKKGGGGGGESHADGEVSVDLMKSWHFGEIWQI